MITEREVVDSCMCHKVRTAARLVTNAYDEELRPAGLRATQFAVLAAVGAEGSMSITALAQILGMDRTTLSRNLGPLERDGLIKVGAEGWRRSRTLEITKKGRTRFREALPHWEHAQEALRSNLGDEKWRGIRSDLDRLVRAA